MSTLIVLLKAGIVTLSAAKEQHCLLESFGIVQMRQVARRFNFCKSCVWNHPRHPAHYRWADGYAFFAIDQQYRTPDPLQVVPLVIKVKLSKRRTVIPVSQAYARFHIAQVVANKIAQQVVRSVRCDAALASDGLFNRTEDRLWLQTAGIEHCFVFRTAPGFDVDQYHPANALRV